MKLLWAVGFCVLLVGCGGGGGGGGATAAGGSAAGGTTGTGGAGNSVIGVPNTPPPSPPAATAQSPGGIWHSFSGLTSSLTLFIAEDGNLRVMDQGPAFGAGAVVVTGGNAVSGSYQARGVQSSPSSPTTQTQTCEVTGTVAQRASLQLAVHCTDTAGVTNDRSVFFLYDPAYEADSSLDAIAGNYTLSFNTQTNSLTIASDGTVFGMFHNGAQCVVNGRVEVIDPRFNLYDFELSFSNCQFLKSYEGQTMTGFAALSMPGMPAGAFLLLVTGMINGRLEFHSLLYERA